MSTTTATPTNDNSLEGARAWFAGHGLTRPADGRMVAGVSAGFARRFNINPLVSRIAAIAIAAFLTPIVYVALWVLMPAE